MIRRIEYLNRLAKLRDRPLVKFLSGVRGCGKTTLLALYIDWLKRSGVDDRQIIFINMEDPESESFLHYQGLYAYIKKHLYTNGVTYVFIDEIQRCANFEKTLAGLLVKKQIDLYAAVSSAAAFSGVPHIEIRVLPLSFAERQLFSRAVVPGRADTLKAFATPGRNAAVNAKPDRRLPRQKEQMEKYLQREDFHQYVSSGGFPFTAALGGDAGLIYQCVEGIYNTVVIREIARKTAINDIPLLENIAKKMGCSIGRPISSKKISTAISAEGRKISNNTAETYMRALCGTFLFYHIGRFDIKAGTPLKTLGKYYIADTGIWNLLLAPVTQNGGLDSQLENIVCMELLRRGFQVYVGKYRGAEINFVAFGRTAEGGSPACFQVMSTIRDKAVYTQKFSSLEQVPGSHPKIILSLDENPFRAGRDGIVHLNLIDWLLKEKQ